jgi:hypothetical protein
MLKSLKLHGVGPVRDLSTTFGERLQHSYGRQRTGKIVSLGRCCFWVSDRDMAPADAWRRPQLQTSKCPEDQLRGQEQEPKAVAERGDL